RGIAFRRNGLSQCLGRRAGRHLYQLAVQIHLDIGGAVHARDGLADMAGAMAAGHVGYAKLHDVLLLVQMTTEPIVNLPIVGRSSTVRTMPTRAGRRIPVAGHGLPSWGRVWRVPHW